MTLATVKQTSATRERTITMTQAGIVVVAAYIAAQILSDIGSLKIAVLAGFSVDGGTFIYPLTFTLRDMIHKLLGRQAARTVIFTAGAINILMALFFAFLSKLPPDPTWPWQEAFVNVLNPVWRIVAASIVAELVSELLDTEVYQAWVTHITPHYQWARVLTSNSVSIPIDSLIFCWGAFGGVLPASIVWSIFWSNILLKGLTTLISLPGIYLVREKEDSQLPPRRNHL